MVTHNSKTTTAIARASETGEGEATDMTSIKTAVWQAGLPRRTIESFRLCSCIVMHCRCYCSCEQQRYPNLAADKKWPFPNSLYIFLFQRACPSRSRRARACHSTVLYCCALQRGKYRERLAVPTLPTYSARPLHSATFDHAT